MAEIGHRALRELIEGFMGEPGKDDAGDRPEYFTEMLSAGALLGGGPFESWYLDAGPCPQRLVYQLVGSDPAQLERAAALLDRRDCLGIDINMGCAAPAIRRNGAGTAWMTDTDRAAAMIGRVREAVRQRRLSVKLRLDGGPQPSGRGPGPGGSPWPGKGGEPGGSSRPRGREPAAAGPVDPALLDYLVRFCRRLEAGGVELITLHPRRAGEKFKRRARWGYVEALRRELTIPVAGNGDIGNAAELLRRAGEGRTLRAMVGRAAVRQPWIFAEARFLAGSGTGRRSLNLEETALRFLELLARYQPPEFHISRARRFFNYFCDNLKWGTYLKNLLNREENLAGIEKTWKTYFAAHPEEGQLHGIAL
jgi:tRNA-dihydrouridine synthase